MIEENQSLFMKMRPELDALTDKERVLFAVAVTKYALIRASSFDVDGGEKKAIIMPSFKEGCCRFADEVLSFPASINEFAAEIKRRS